MKFYNPFKSHIIQFTGGFLIRRLSFFGWACLCNNFFWWSDRKSIRHFCIFKLKEDAEATLDFFKIKGVRL